VEHTETLLTLAEIGVGIAGFSSLVMVFGRRAQDPGEPYDRFAIRNLLMMSFLAVFASLIPVGLHAFEMTGPELWRWSSGAFLFLIVIEASTGLPSYIAMRPTTLACELSLC